MKQNNMKEQEIIDLGFEKEFIEEFDGDEAYYYALDVVKGICLITPDSDYVKDDNWTVEILEPSPSVVFTDINEVKQFIDIIKRNIVKQ